MKRLLNLSVLLFVVLALLGICVDESVWALARPAPPLIREGVLAVKLTEALKLGHASSEAEAESILESAGISPRRGWMADYPVTPIIMDEIREAVSQSAKSKRVSLDDVAAMNVLDGIQQSMRLPLPRSGAGHETNPPQTVSGPEQQAPEDINDYASDSPPILTYYRPPTEYAYLYDWVPYRYWWGGYWFPGFFVLRDFHRHFHHHGHDFMVSNHFRAHHGTIVDIGPTHNTGGRGVFVRMGPGERAHFVAAVLKQAHAKDSRQLIHVSSGAKHGSGRRPAYVKK